jgi:hypothetical protein
MALNTDQKASKNFKKLIGKAETTTAREFYSEPYSGKPSVLADQIWAESDSIPTTAPVLAADAISGVVQYKEDLVLTAVSGTSNAFYHADLVDAIPFYYGDGTSYLYTLKDSTGATIPAGSGDWIVDPDAGVLSFYGTVPANMPPKISFYKYVGIKGVDASTAEFETLDYRSLAVETSNRTIYIATTGDDDTGDGSSGNPFFSIHRALRDIKPEIDCDITISLADGSYDYSSLGILSFNKRFLASRTLTIQPTSLSSAMTDAFTVETSGTFTSSVANVHTQSGASWTPSEFKGKFLKVKTVLSGSLPSGSVNGDYGLLPIIDNGADWIKTPFTHYVFSDDFGQFDILTHDVTISLGGEDCVLKDSSMYLNWKGIEITTNGDFEDTILAQRNYYSVDDNFGWLFYNCNLNISQTSSNINLISSRLNIADGLSFVHSSLSSHLICPYTNATYANFRLKGGAFIMASVYEHTGAADVSILGIENNDLVSFGGDVEFIGGKYCIFAEVGTKIGNVVFPVTFHLNSQAFFLRNGSKDISVIDTSSFAFDSEPTTGRLTIDGTNAATEYYNAESGLNALAIAPDAKKIIYLGDNPVDYRSLEIITDSVTYYISPTGDDDTGAGTEASPWFSIHKVHKALPPVTGANVTVKCATGTYDFSSLGDLNFYKKFTFGMFIIRPEDCSTALYEGFTVDSSDSFTSNAGNIHTKTDAGWTPGALKGGFIRVKTVTSGSIGPSSLYDEHSVFPIVDNGADWIETPYAYATYSNNFETFDFITPKVELDFGTNDITLSDGIMIFRPSGIKITADSIIDDDTGNRQAEYAFYSVACDVNCSTMMSTPVFYNSRLSVTGYLTQISQATSSYLTSSYTSTFNPSFMLGDTSRLWSATIENTAGVNAVLCGTRTTEGTFLTLAGNNVFKNGKVCIQSASSDTIDFLADYGLSFTLDTQSFFVWNRFGTLNLVGGVATFNSEPTVARLSQDNTNAATEYYNAESGLNAMGIAPDASKYMPKVPASNEDVDTGTEIVDSLPDVTGHGACMWHYLVVDSTGANKQTGLITATWDASADNITIATGVTATEGTVSGVTFSAVIVSNVVELSVTVGTDNWKVYTDRISTL